MENPLLNLRLFNIPRENTGYSWNRPDYPEYDGASLCWPELFKVTVMTFKTTITFYN